MFKNIELNGFKSFVCDSIEFGKLTLLTGLNSSGKSSVIQSILMLEKAIRAREALLDGHGDIDELKNNYSENLEIILNLNDGNQFLISNDSFSPSQDIEFPQLTYISASRYGSESSMPIYVGNNFNIGSRGENIFNCIDHYRGHLLPEIVQHQKSETEGLLKNIKAWLGEISPNIDFQPEILKQSDSSFATFNKFRAKNVGFGLSYTLPVITALLVGTLTPGCVVMIENPEAHLHPRGQTEIAKLICMCVEAGVQVIIETHSDHLFDGVCIFAKNSTTNFHESVKTYWFELDKNRNTDVQEVIIDKDGRLESCPKGLLDQYEINARKLL